MYKSINKHKQKENQKNNNKKPTKIIITKIIKQNN